MSQWKDDPPKVSISSQRVNCAWKSPVHARLPEAPHPSTPSSSPGPGARSPRWIHTSAVLSAPAASVSDCVKGRAWARAGGRGRAEGCRGPLQGRPPGMPREAPTFTVGDLPAPRTFFLLSRGGPAPNPRGTVQGLTTPPKKKNINPTGTKAG